MLSSSRLRLLPRLPFTPIIPSVFPSVTCFRRQFLCNMWPIRLAFLLFILYRIFLSSLTVCNTTSFITRSVQLFFSLLLQHHISKLSRYFSSSFQGAQFSSPYKATPQVLHFTVFFLLKFKANFLVKRFFLVECCFSKAILDLISCYILQHLLSVWRNGLNIAYSPFFSTMNCTGDSCLQVITTLAFFPLTFIFIS